MSNANLPAYRLLGAPRRFKTKGKRSKHYLQRFRLDNDPVRKVRSVSLRTQDTALARRRAADYVEERVLEIAEDRDPELRTVNGSIKGALKEYIDDLFATGNTEKQGDMVKGRIERIIEKAAFTEYAQIDAVQVTKAIAGLQKANVFKTTATANKYLEAMRAWASWMKRNGRWSENSLADMEKIKGDTSNSRPRAILTQEQFEKLLRITIGQPDRRNLTGEQRHWLYLISSQTGLRAQECNSLTPANFHLDEDSPYVEIRNTISERGKKTGRKDRIMLQSAFAVLLCEWLADKPNGEPLWSNSRSWWYKAAEILRHDLNAAELPHHVKTREGESVVDFHCFRAYRISSVVSSGASLAVVKNVARLSSESLVARYTKIADEEITRTINSIPVPNVKRRTHSLTHSAPHRLGKSGRLTADQAAGCGNEKSR